MRIRSLQKIKDVGRWCPWTERVLRLARVQSPDLHAALSAALKARDTPVTHEPIYF